MKTRIKKGDYIQRKRVRGDQMNWYFLPGEVALVYEVRRNDSYIDIIRLTESNPYRARLSTDRKYWRKLNPNRASDRIALAASMLVTNAQATF